MESLASLSNESLTQTLFKLRIGEKEVISDVVRYLAELDSRKLYLELGHSSLFSYCRNALGYSEGGAYRRIQAARLVRDNQEVYEKLRSGSLTLCAVAEISKVKEGRAAVIEASEGQSGGLASSPTVLDPLLCNLYPFKERDREGKAGASTSTTFIST